MNYLYIALTVVLGLIICFAVYQTARIRGFIEVSKELIDKVAPYEQHPSNPESHLLFLGDSTAVGVGSALVQETVAGRFGTLFPHADIINRGVSGQKIAELSSKFEPAEYPKLDLVVIQIGANDIIRFSDPSTVEKSLDILLTKALRSSDKVVVLHSGNIGLAPFFPSILRPLWSKRTEVVREIYIRKAEELGVVYVDLYKKRQDDAFSKDPQRYYAKDGLHLTGDGYGIWFESIREALATKYGKDFL